MRIITCREIAYIWQTSCWNDRTLDQLMCKIAACAVSKRLMHMQNNTWIRKSNRIHQPEAQDGKTCPTSSDMLGASRWPLNWYGLPLQIRYFNFLCFNWEAGPHSAMGPEPTWRHWHSELSAFWKLPLRLVGMIAETQPTVKLEGPGQGQGPVGAQSNSRHLLRLCPLHSPSQSGHLTSQGLFPSCADVNQHICHTNLKACHNAGMGYREMPIQVRAGDVMAGGGPGGAAGPVQSIRHQAPGNLAWNATNLI